jgi:hypothetical protein
VAKFYSARSKTISPLPWFTFALPFSSKTLNVKLDFPVAVTEFVLFEYKAKDSDE